jgi:hypothetical protein
VRIPASFAGTLLLHPYLADLAIALDQLDILQSFLDRMRTRRRARVGFHSNLGREAVNASLLLERPPHAISLLTSPNGGLGRIPIGLDDDPRARGMTLLAEVGPAPLAVHDLARAAPERWSSDRGTTVVSALAFAHGDEHVETAWHAAWSTAFPGAPSVPLSYAR